MQQMQSMMGSMSPAMMQEAMRAMQGATPADLERARQQMAQTDPATLASQAQEASKMLSARQQYVINVSAHGRAARRAVKRWRVLF